MQIESKRYPIIGYATSLIGGRPENQDDMGWVDTPLGFLLVVCDGMGGGPGGKTASYIAKQVFMQTIYECSPQSTREDVIKLATSRANDALYRKMDEDSRLRGMGSTLVAILINEESAVVAHLGDSRCYRMQNRKILFRTHDHSLVGELVIAKALTEEQARVSPQSNVITRALGNTNNHVAEIEEVPYRKGDRFFLCTDGVWGEIPQEDLLLRLGNGMPLESLVENLQKEVDNIGLASGGHYDNHTLAVVEIQMDSKLKDKWDMKSKWILGVLAILLLMSLLVNIFVIKNNVSTKALMKQQSESFKQQIENLQQEIEVLGVDKDKEYRESAVEKSTLQAEKEQLEKEKAELEKKVTELESKLENMENTESQSGKGKKKSVSNADSPVKADSPAKNNINAITKLLDEMIASKDKDQTALVKHLMEKCENVKKKMVALKAATIQRNYREKLDKIIQSLPSEKEVTVQRNGTNDYSPTNVLKKKLDNVKKQLETL